MLEYDVIIVGGGPAGIAAAQIFNKNNINYCLIDKCKFPREKLCGGGLTNKSIKLLKSLDINIDDIPSVKVNTVKLVAGKIKKDMILDNNIVMIDRKTFDNNNIRHIVKNNLYEQEKITNITDNTLITDKNTYKFKYIIFADGINGYSRNLIKERKFGFCVEYETNITAKDTYIDFDTINNGYGWIFPKKNSTTIGLGGFNNKKCDYVKSLENFMNKYGYKVDKSKIRGYHIPIFSKSVYQKSVIDNRFILVGDAASLVNPISGEGIFYALASGKNAALSIIECLNGNNNLKETYFNKNIGIYNSLKKMSYLSKLFYSKKKNILIKIGLSKEKYIKKLNRVFG